MPGITSIARFSPKGGRLPPLSREAEDAIDHSSHRNSPLQTTSAAGSTSAKTLSNSKGFTVSQANIASTRPKSPNNLQVALQTSKDMSPAISSRKPRFLDDLENFLIKELSSLGVEEIEANDTRLQAHREVFEYLIEDFKTYKPIFAAIKNEYEMMLQHQFVYIKQLEPLQQMLVTVTEQCDNEVMRLRDEEKNEIYELKKESEKLQSIIDSIKNDLLALQIQVERLEQKLSDQYDKYRSEANARKLLVSDINDLRLQQEELILQQQQASNRDESEDAGLMRIALKKTRESEKAASQMLNDIIANYGDVIPKQDFLSLQEQYKALQQTVSEKAAEFDQLKAEHDSLLETHKQVIKQRAEFYQERERLREMATPRPDWPRCGDVIAGGMQRWNELSQGKSSDEMVSILLDELAGSSADSNTPDYFDALGTGDEVPFYLRKEEGTVRNRYLGKRDTTLLIKDVWKEKDIYDTNQGAAERNSMSQYFIHYLTDKFPDDAEMVAEWAYNVDNACQRYVHDDKLQLFYNVINSKVDQELYFSQLHAIVGLLQLLNKENEEHDPPDEFTVEEFTQVLTTYFSGQVTPAEVEDLVKAAQLELDDPEAKTIAFTKLFFEDDEGKFGPFVDEVKALHNNVRVKYFSEIVESLKKDGLEEIAPENVIVAMTAVDPDLEDSRKQATVAWVYKVKTKAELDAATSISLDELKARLNTVHIKKFF
ncbi:translin-associated factor X-interacting protein 1-like [Watersipora subatra]|uniref:translin-associated factor X-interacting protein 1-like n=1 Tax=Watersipora subatra TaxID=2589382 RepID=UPI00355C7F67